MAETYREFKRRIFSAPRVVDAADQETWHLMRIALQKGVEFRLTRTNRLCIAKYRRCPKKVINTLFERANQVAAEVLINAMLCQYTIDDMTANWRKLWKAREKRLRLDEHCHREQAEFIALADVFRLMIETGEQPELAINVEDDK